MELDDQRSTVRFVSLNVLTLERKLNVKGSFTLIIKMTFKLNLLN